MDIVIFLYRLGMTTHAVRVPIAYNTKYNITRRALIHSYSHTKLQLTKVRFYIQILGQMTDCAEMVSFYRVSTYRENLLRNVL